MRSYNPNTASDGTRQYTSASDVILANQNNQKEDSTKRGIAGEILPVAGSIVGGIGGGVLGAAGGGPVGAYLGAVGGSAAGAAVGETAQQGIEKAIGSRESLNPTEIGQTAVRAGALEAIGGPVAAGVGKVISGTGKIIYKAAIPTSAREAQLVQAYKADVPLLERIKSGVFGSVSKSPRTAAETSISKNLIGTESMIGVQARRASNSLWNDLISPQLKSVESKVNMPDLFKEAEKKIKSDNPELARQGDLLNALKALKEDYKKVKDVSYEDLQKYKEGWAKFVPEKAYKGKPIAGAFNDVKDILSEISRDKIYTALGPEVKQAYFDYGNLKGIQELGQKAMTGGKLKGGFGSFWSGIKDMAITPVATVGGNIIYRTGNGVQFIGKPGGRFVRDLFVGIPDIGKDIVNPSDESQNGVK